MQDVDFGDPTPAVFPLKISGKRYLIREISCADRVRRDALAERHTVRGEGGKFVKFDEDFGQVLAETISMCLFENDSPNGDGQVFGKNVPVETISAWPDSFREKLSAKVMELCPSLQTDDEAEIDRQIELLLKRKAELANGKAPSAKN